jgi:hypothetical protein
MKRFWLLYPAPARTFIRINTQFVLGVVVIVGGSIALAFAAEWLGRWLPHR